LIYGLDEVKDILFLNKLRNIKVIFYHHSSAFGWIYENYKKFKTIYTSFMDSKYVVSIVPFESDYLFKKWGIRSILMNNFITYEFKSVIQTDLTCKIIIMIGRGNSKNKRFILGIQSMEYIIEKIPECKLNIISNKTGINILQNFVENTNLKNNIKFIGYIASPDIFFKNVSLHFFLSIAEAFPMVLIETKIYGIPNILLGLDYISISKGGVIIIFDDTPEILAKESINILKSKRYKKRLSLEARKSMKKFNNEFLLIKWVKLILSIYNDDDYYLIHREEYKEINEIKAIKIIENQIKLLRMREKNFLNLSRSIFENYTQIISKHII
jgi:glycosyltransferase involved in cell wall biosynthesis